MTGAMLAVFGWLMAASTLLLWLVPVVAVVDRLTARWWSPDVRAWLWRLLLVRALLPTAVIPGTTPLAMPALVGEGEGGLAVTLWLWLAGAVLFLWFGALSAWRQRCRLRRETTASDVVWQTSLRSVARRFSLSRLPALRISTTGAGPCVVGILRPEILVPAHLRELPGPARDHLLAHELAHIVRRDALRTLLLLPVLVVFWFHPGMWFLTLRLRALREVAADAAAVRSTGGAFAATLRACVQAQLQPVRGLAMVGTLAELRERFAALRRPPGRRRPVLALLVAVLLAVCCVPVAARMPSLTELGELPGCLQKRFLVLGALAREQAAEPR
ncbi:MAG: M56 family metallopeptidase [Planctomycetes bacterium]|nr:M56 family metallopeptidase [Planctomycetota bacterium]